MEQQKNTQKGDPNFFTVTRSKDGMKFANILDTPIKLTGYPWLTENGNYNRIPDRIMDVLPEQLRWVAVQPSGGMLHFNTDSRRMSLDIELLRDETSAQCSQNLLSGFDVYIDCGKGLKFERNLGVEGHPMAFTADMPWDMPEGMKEIKIYFPLQNPIKRVELGLDEGANIEDPTPFAVEKPILFYGSSITCGFCASRPGLTYPAKITRALNAEMINLGFGGGAHGEVEIAQAIAELDLSCLVIDYDCNASTAEFLEQTHYKFFETIRLARPELPILIVSAPFYWKSLGEYEKRRNVIQDTYLRALSQGDKHVAFLDGGTMFPRDSWFDCTTDCLHPNDLGFIYMEQAIKPYICELLGISY